MNVNICQQPDRKDEVLHFFDREKRRPVFAAKENKDSEKKNRHYSDSYICIKMYFMLILCIN